MTERCSSEFVLTTISCTVEDGVALVRFERPDRGNAWTAEMQRDYRSVMARAEADPLVRVVVLTGSGKAFCVGGDMETLSAITESGVLTPQPPDPLAEKLFGTDLGSFAFVLRMSKPVIAAINGPAAGVGFVLSCFCDLRFAAEGAKLTVAMARLGLPAEQGLSWILPRIVGLGAAAELLLTGIVVRAEQALEMGLLHGVLPAGELLDAVMERARLVARDVAPTSSRLMKRQLYADLTASLPESIVAANEVMGAALAGPDYREGVAAFLERRPAQFTTC